MALKRQNNILPTFDELIIPTIEALLQLGGSGTVEEINNKVYELTELPDATIQIPHGEEGKTTEIAYRLAWSRTYLRKYGLLNNSSRGIWSLLNVNIDTKDIDINVIKRTVREKSKLSETKANSIIGLEKQIEEEIDGSESWKSRLLDTLYSITPEGFERLTQRILRESGFFQVEVTGKIGDGGIDGRGIARINGLLSFPVIFQCKRYNGSVPPGAIRDFRGAMQGRADKGIFITTGRFTREAVKEATRDGVPPIDLIDGDLLCDKLKELQLGVNTKLIERIEVIPGWFVNL